MTERHGCTELRRLEQAEDHINDVKDSLTGIKDTLYAIEKEFNVKLTTMTEAVTRLMGTMESIAVKADERDRRNSEIFQENRASFERYGKSIDELENNLASHDKLNAQQDLKIGTLEKVLYGGLSALGALGLWILNLLFEK